MVSRPPTESTADGGITYRTAVPEDGTALRHYLIQVFAETDFLSQSAEDPPASETQVTQIIADASKGPNQLLLLAEAAGEIIGMLRFKGGATRRTCHIGEAGITVLKAHWGRGTASGLLTRFLSWATHGRLIRQINLRVRLDNLRALALYRRYGFTETGRMKRDLNIDGRFYDHLLMGLAIDPPGPAPPKMKAESAAMPSTNTHRSASGFSYLAQPETFDPQHPTLLFLHGSGHNAAFWEYQLCAMSAQANCLALDLPGHGRNAAAVCTSVAEHAATVCDFLDELGTETLVTGHVIPVGLSLGGAIVQWLLIHHPDRCRAGVIVNSGARLKVAAAIFEALKQDHACYLQLIKELALSPTHFEDAEIDAILKRCTTRNASVTATDFRCCDAFDVMAELNRIDRPVLVLAAEEDRLTPAKYGAFLTDAIPGAHQVILADAGHFSPLEQPVAFNAAISEFVQSLPNWCDREETHAKRR